MDHKITIGFTLENEHGDKFTQSSTVEVFYDLGDTELSVIGEQLNAFLNLCGYIRRNNNILMEDLTDEEYDALAVYLEQLRGEGRSCVSQ